MLSGVFGFRPLVRRQVHVIAARFGARASVTSAALFWGGIRLRGVDVRAADIPGLAISFDRVDVSLGGSARHVRFFGGVIAASGPRDVLLPQVVAWSEHHFGNKASSGLSPMSSRTVELSDGRFEWRNAPEATEAIALFGIKLSQVDDHFSVAFDKAVLLAGGAAADVTNGRLSIVRRAGTFRLANVDADALEARLALSDEAGYAPPSKGSLATLGAPPLTRTAMFGGRLADAARAIDVCLDPSFKIWIAGVHATLKQRGEVLNLGPGSLTILRADARILVELAPKLRTAPLVEGTSSPVLGSHTPEQPLTFRLGLPLTNGLQEIVVDVAGGPLWLSSLGVREGDLGLFDVALASLSTKSHMILSGDGKNLHVDGEGMLHNLSLRNRALADEAIGGLQLGFRAQADFGLDGEYAHVAHGQVDLGLIRLSFEGDLDRVHQTLPPGATVHEATVHNGRGRGRDGKRHPVGLPTGSGGEGLGDFAQTPPEDVPGLGNGVDGYRFRGTVDVPLAACQATLESAPAGLLPALRGLRLAGSFSLRGHAEIDTTRLDRTFLLDWDASNTCRVVDAPPSIAVDRFRKGFRRTAYDAQGRPFEIDTGPGTPDWVPLGAISRFMGVAVLTTEDGAFFRHQGFDREAIKNSIRENIRSKRFLRGASTISMQLAKNLYLDRGKNLSRKLQEAVLTMYLEQTLTKDQILELYLNVVEFGPMIYGIGPAAQHYFGTTPRDLSFGQALYISSIMPNPKIQHFGRDGAVTPQWMAYLHQLMKLAYGRNRVTAEELDEGLRETVVRGAPAPSRAPRGDAIDPMDSKVPRDPMEE